MHLLHHNPHIPVKFSSVVLSHGSRLDLSSLTMVPHDLQAVAAGAQDVCGIWIGVDVILSAGQMLVD
jgi:hypothetical protein